MLFSVTFIPYLGRVAAILLIVAAGDICLIQIKFYIIFYLFCRFDIRLMKEGRMKGQAFITFPTEDQAKQALTDTNGFVLHSKPMAVVSHLLKSQ